MLARTLRRFSRPPQTYLHTPGSSSKRKVTLIPGLFIGPEVVSSVQRVISTAAVPIEFETLPELDFSNEAFKTALLKNKFILLGNLANSKAQALENLEFYKFLNLFARVVHVFNLPNVPTRHKNIDIVIIRENLEGEFSGVEHEVVPGVFESLKLCTLERSLALAQYAFDFAYFTGRKRVTAVHKANIMKLTDGLFLEACRGVAKKYPSIDFKEIIIDNCAMQMVQRPQQFDVIVTGNLYGSIVSSIGAGLVGGAGVVSGSNIGENYMVFDQGLRASAHDIAGKGLANPTAMINTCVNMLRSMNLMMFADLIHEGLMNVYKNGGVLTRDLGGKATTNEFTEEVCRQIEKLK